MVLSKNKHLFNRNMAWLCGSSVLYVVLKQCCVKFIDSFCKTQRFVINTFLGQVSVIANDIVFPKNYHLFNRKIAWFYCSCLLYVVLKRF